MEKCRNFNHGKVNVNIRYCVDCGQIVNRNIPKGSCNDSIHADRRKSRSMFCIDCGIQLSEK